MPARSSGMRILSPEIPLDAVYVNGVIIVPTRWRDRGDAGAQDSIH
jgi:hypothetical protein